MWVKSLRPHYSSSQRHGDISLLFVQSHEIARGYLLVRVCIVNVNQRNEHGREVLLLCFEYCDRIRSRSQKFHSVKMWKNKIAQMQSGKNTKVASLHPWKRIALISMIVWRVNKKGIKWKSTHIKRCRISLRCRTYIRFMWNPHRIAACDVL